MFIKTNEMFSKISRMLISSSTREQDFTLGQDSTLFSQFQKSFRLGNFSKNSIDIGTSLPSVQFTHLAFVMMAILIII